MAETKKLYFGEQQQRAVIRYKYSESVAERNEIFNKSLYKPFQQMIAAILRRYSFHMGKYTPEELECNAMTHLVENFEKFDEWKPDKIESFITFDFKKNIEYDGKIHFDKKGLITSVECDGNEEFETYLNTELKDKKTIHHNAIIPVKFKIKSRKNNKKFLNVTVDKEYQEKNYFHLDMYYKLKLPNTTQEKRFEIYKKLKYKIYCPIYEERLAFSYCQTIVKNFFINHSDTTYKDKINNIKMKYSDEGDEDTKNIENGFIYYMQNTNIREAYENIIQECIEEIDLQLHHNEFLTTPQKDIGYALIEVLKRWELVLTGDEDDSPRNIKSNIANFVIEQTGLQRKEVVANLKWFYNFMDKTKKRIINEGTYEEDFI